MRILHISDTHGFHRGLNLEEADVLCFTGDESNYRNVYRNHNEFLDFYEWLSSIRNKYKHVVFIAGNHSSWVFNNEKEARKLFKEINVHYLNDESVVLDGIEFYGSPWSPTFGDWCFMQKRETLNRRWELIPPTTEVLLTHTPPKNILDLTEDRYLEAVGCGALRKQIDKLPHLKAHLFGHIHDLNRIENNGVFVKNKIQFSNASCVKDREFDKGIIHHGNIIKI